MTPAEIKQIIQKALESNDLDALVAFARRNKGVLSLLIRASYDKETLAGWRAIKAIGRIAKALVRTDYDFLRETVRKLLWSLSDESGGIGWAAPEILGEIICADLEKFADIVPLIAEVYEVEEDVFRPGVVYALARIAEINPRLAAGYQEIIIRSLADKDPLMRIYALQLVDRLWRIAIKDELWTKEYTNRIFNYIDKLKNDHKVAWIYHNDGFIDIEVGEKAKKMTINIK